MSQPNDDFDPMELPEIELRKSKTWLRYIDACGMCSRCKEHTSLLDPCCGVPVYFEGSSFNFANLWESIREELIEAAEARIDLDAQAKDDKIDFGGEK